MQTQTTQFWLIYLMAFLSIFQGFYVLNVYKDYGQTVEALADDAYLTKVGSVAALLSAIRFPWSGAMDLSLFKAAPFKTVYGFQLCLQTFLGFTLPMVHHSRVLFAIWVCLIMWTEGAHFVVLPSAIKSIFGGEANTIYATLFSYSGISAILMLFIVKSQFGSNYESVFKLSALLSLTALVILLCCFKENRIKCEIYG